MAVVSRISRFLDRLYGIPALLPDWFFQLFARLAIAPVFWLSAKTKVANCSYMDVLTMRFWWDDESACIITNATWAQFEGDWQLPFINSEWSAYMATMGEHILPVLVVLGLATRFGALGLLAMTMVIQVFVYPQAWWGTHALWTFALLFIVARGPGPISIDYILGRLTSRR